jgi:membrane-bound ClpP family serine protease
MVLWLILVFVSFGLFAPRNVTAIASVFAAALAVSGAIFLILEMYMPFTGLIQISSALSVLLSHISASGTRNALHGYPNTLLSVIACGC